MRAARQFLIAFALLFSSLAVLPAANAQTAAEAAQQAAEETARAAADAANCVPVITSFTGDPRWERTFPAVCTAAGIAARVGEMDNYFNYVTAQRLAEPNPAPINPPPPISNLPAPPGGYINNPEIGIDCGTILGMQSAWCLNQQQGYNPITGVWGTPPIISPLPNVPTALTCALPENAALPICVQNQRLINADGSINCAQPMNAITTTCMDLFRVSNGGQLDCAKPELKNMPVCIINSAVLSPNLGSPTPTTGLIPQVNVAVTPGASSSPSTPQKTSEKVTKKQEELFTEEDGEEEPPVGSIEVSYSGALARYVIKVECNLAGEKLSVRGVKKGAQAIRFSITIDDDGIGGVRTKTKLSGYTMTLYYGNLKLDQIRVK